MRAVTVFLVSAQYANGKDLFGYTLAKTVGGVTIALADPVKKIALALGMPYSVAYGGEAERRAWTKYLKPLGRDADGREWLQWIGTEFGRDQLGDTIWVERLAQRIAEREDVTNFVVTDARFKNELFAPMEEALEAEDLDAVLVRIRLKRPGHANSDPHQSEAEQLEISDFVFDELVANEGTPEDLAEKAKAIGKRYTGA